MSKRIETTWSAQNGYELEEGKAKCEALKWLPGGEREDQISRMAELDLEGRGFRSVKAAPAG